MSQNLTHERKVLDMETNQQLREYDEIMAEEQAQARRDMHRANTTQKQQKQQLAQA